MMARWRKRTRTVFGGLRPKNAQSIQAKERIDNVMHSVNGHIAMESRTSSDKMEMESGLG